MRHDAFLHYTWALHAIHWGGGGGAFSSGGSHCHLVTSDCVWVCVGPGHWCLGINDWESLVPRRE